MTSSQSSIESLQTPGSLAKTGFDLVESITQYLSTIPTPVDVLEDLTSIVAVISSLLSSLDYIIPQYSLPSARKLPFLSPLCLDVEAAFDSLKGHVEETKKKKVFEPNEKGLVRTPRFAWFDKVGGEGKAAALRRRLCVEKYRVRVLIDALRFKQLSDLKDLSALKIEEAQELAELKQLLPVIVERLLGVQEDYLPRLRKEVTDDTDSATLVPEKEEEAVNSDAKDDITKAKLGLNTIDLKSTSSWVSKPVSSVTTVDDSIEEAWLLRQIPPKSELRKSHYICGVRTWETYQHRARSFYVKPLPATTSEIVAIRQSALGDLTQSAHEVEIKKTITRMSGKAQYEIQHLLETRDKACSTNRVKRNWEVVAFQEKPRRKITPPVENKWWKRGKKPSVEWVMVLKGETVDHQNRMAPAKDENPWNTRRDTKRPVKMVISQKPGDVLTHIEKRNFMPMDEAERKMEELLRDLFEPLADD